MSASTSSSPPDLHAEPGSPKPGGGWGPTVRGGRRRRWPWIAGALAVLLLIPMLYGLVLVNRLSGSIQRAEVTALSPHEGGPTNLLVIGSDSREGLSAEDQVELGTGFVEGERTDSIFILSLDGSRAAILAFPRDLFVTRCDGSEGRINAALVTGGPDCLIDTVEQTSGIPIHHWVAVSFGGFRDIVDAVGGVDLCVDKELTDPFAGISIQPGCQTLTGRQALGFVRTRKLDNDLERIKRQQQFLGALAAKVATPSTVLNPSTAFSVTSAVGEALTADHGLGPVGLMRLANGARGLASGRSVTTTVPATGASIGGASVLRIQDDQAQPLFASFRDGSIFDRATGGLTREEVSVRVLNGAGVPGLAGTTRDALAALGYQVAGIGDAPASDATVIRHPEALADHARLLADDLPIEPRLEATAEVSEVTLVLGPDLADGL